MRERIMDWLPVHAPYWGLSPKLACALTSVLVTSLLMG